MITPHRTICHARKLLSAAERDRLSRFPREISREDLAAYFTLSDQDLAAIARLRGDYTRLGFALQLAAIRLLELVPTELHEVPQEAVDYLAEQLGVVPEDLDQYDHHPKTVREHSSLPQPGAPNSRKR